MLKRFAPVITLVAACWLVLVANNLVWNGQLNQHGIIPRHLSGLPGIVWAPFLHASFKHLLANTLPLLVLGGIICARGKTEFWSIAAAGTSLPGALPTSVRAV
jgi:membrane associated rhomboid family serine protease